LGALVVQVKRNPGIVGRSETLSETFSKRVFIGHGHSAAWKDIREFLVQRLGLEHEEFNREPAAGKSNKERLQEMLSSSDFALIIMTAEDETRDGEMRARENAVHEAGLFQGKLGFERAIILREEGCEEIRRILERERLISKSRK